MGNHTIAEAMFRHDPAVMLHAPLRTLINADPDGDTKLAVDQPSLLFASYNNPDIETVGYRLDYLLSLLIINLGGSCPQQCGTRHDSHTAGFVAEATGRQRFYRTRQGRRG